MPTVDTLCLAFVVAILLISSCSGEAATPIDAGYELLIEDSPKPIAPQCASIQNLPAYINGTWVLPTVGMYGIGDQKFQAILDGFGKMHKWSITGGKVCVEARMMNTGFYNASTSLGHIAPSLLFVDTIPPSNTTGMQKLQGPNDNTFVNTIQVGPDYYALTDSQKVLKFDLETMQMLGLVNFTDKTDNWMFALGSAHPIRDATEGCWYSVEPMNDIFSVTHWVHTYKLCDNNPTFRTVVNSYMTDYTPYFHSFGLTEKYTVLPHNLFTVDFDAVISDGGILANAFKSVKNSQQELYLSPLDGSKATQFLMDRGDSFYYVHIVNSYDSEDGAQVIMDVSAFPENPFISNAVNIAAMKNKTARDDISNRAMLTRIVVNVSGTKQGKVEKYRLQSDTVRSTDFCKINGNYSRKKYCFVYCNQWFADEGITFGAMSVTKFNVCNAEIPGKKTEVGEWHIDGYFPSEPTFIPSDRPGADEDEGTLLFGTLFGAEDKSSLTFVDAKTMKTIAEMPLPQRMTFTTHGEFFRDILAVTSPKA